jgi:hypothetical protein
VPNTTTAGAPIVTGATPAARHEPDELLAERLADACFGGDETAVIPPGTRNQGPGTRNSSAEGADTPGGTRVQQPELYSLLRECEEGRLLPVEVQLGALPANATADMAAVAEDVALLLGLRHAAGDTEPLPYAVRFCAQRCGWIDPRRAGRALRALCSAGVIRHVGSMPARGKKDGTKLYAPPLPVTSPGTYPLESEPVNVEPVAPFQPEREASDQRVVRGAESGERLKPRTAPRNAAQITVGRHANQATGATGTNHDHRDRDDQRTATRKRAPQ